MTLRLGLAAFAVLFAVAVLGPLGVPADPTAIDLSATLETPSARHPLGRDGLGRDVGSRLVYGARLSLAVGFATVAIALVLGTAVGLVAGMAGGWIDEGLMRLVDVLLAFPGILLAIAATAVLGPSLINVTIALAAIGWTGYARLVRAETLALRERPHVEAARALGAGWARITILHILPLVAGPLAVQATFGLAGAIVAEASLSFLGLGASPPTPSWGSMLAEGRVFLLVAPHLTIFPTLAVFAAVLSIHLLGEGLRRRITGER